MTDTDPADIVPATATLCVDSRRLAEEILAGVGPTQLLALGPVPAELCAHLAAAGCELRSEAETTAEPAQTLLLAVDNTELPALEARLFQLRGLVGRNLVLLVAPAPGAPGRTWIEETAIRAGYRRHPAAFSLPDFERNNGESTERPLLFARIPDTVLACWPLERLRAGRDLHMDMTREAGARADAHLVRYSLAAEWIRPGDVVLDCACGLGYGTAVLAARSPGSRFLGIDIDPQCVDYARDNFGARDVDYCTASAIRLASVAERSFDFVVSFETMEHLEDYASFVAEAARVLRPGGRIIVSVPNLWADETGRDPNPYHHHVFDYERCRAALEPHFRVVARYAQTAPGGTKLTGARRYLRQQALPPPQEDIDTEWWIVVADLVAGTAVESPDTAPPPPGDEAARQFAGGVRALVSGKEATALAAFAAGIVAGRSELDSNTGRSGATADALAHAAQCARALDAMNCFHRSPGLFWRRTEVAGRYPGDPFLSATREEELAELARLRDEVGQLRSLTRLRTLLPLRLREVALIVLPRMAKRLFSRSS